MADNYDFREKDAPHEQAKKSYLAEKIIILALGAALTAVFARLINPNPEYLRLDSGLDIVSKELGSQDPQAGKTPRVLPEEEPTIGEKENHTPPTSKQTLDKEKTDQQSKPIRSLESTTVEKGNGGEKPAAAGGAESSSPPDYASSEVVSLRTPTLLFHFNSDGSDGPERNPLYAAGVLMMDDGKWLYVAGPKGAAPGGWGRKALTGQVTVIDGSSAQLKIIDKPGTYNPFAKLRAEHDGTPEADWLPVKATAGVGGSESLLLGPRPSILGSDLPGGTYFATGRTRPNYLSLHIRLGRASLQNDKQTLLVGNLEINNNLVSVGDQSKGRALIGYYIPKQHKLLLFFICKIGELPDDVHFFEEFVVPA